MDWPSMPPDLNPIEHLWGNLKWKVEERKVSNIHLLHDVVIYPVIQAVHSLLYIVAKYHLYSVDTWKYILKYLQKCEGCTHFSEILYVYVCVCVCVCVCVLVLSID